MREMPFVIAAYSVFWIVLGSYTYYLSRRRRRAVASLPFPK
jgi:CcmD family protein